jgi:hypothetical protein
VVPFSFKQCRLSYAQNKIRSNIFNFVYSHEIECWVQKSKKALKNSKLLKKCTQNADLCIFSTV